MADYYQIPTLILLSFLVSVFAGLYLRSRTTRTLLWLIGWLFAILRIILELKGISTPALAAIANCSLEMAGVMFLGSMSPLKFGRKHKTYYVVAAAAPLIAFTVLMSLFPQPGILVRCLLLANAVATVCIATLWSCEKNILPVGFSVFFSVAVGLLCIDLAWNGHYLTVIYLARAGIQFITALLILGSYRRISAGVVFTVTGLLLWSLPVVTHTPVHLGVAALVFVSRLANLMKVMTAMGMIVLVLEEEVAINDAATQRDRRARRELEEYAKLNVAILPGYRPSARLCSTLRGRRRQ